MVFFECAARSHGQRWVFLREPLKVLPVIWYKIYTIYRMVQMCESYVCLPCPVCVCFTMETGTCLYIYFLFLWNRIEIAQQPHTVYGNGISHQAAWLHFCKQSIKQSYSTIVATTTNWIHICQNFNILMKKYIIFMHFSFVWQRPLLLWQGEGRYMLLTNAGCFFAHSDQE